MHKETNQSPAEPVDLPRIGAITGIRGIKNLWRFFDVTLSPLGFTQQSSGNTTAKYVGHLHERDLAIKLSYRKQSKYFGSANHMSRVRVFHGLDFEVKTRIAVNTRAVIGKRIGGNGLFRKFLLWLTRLRGARLIQNEHPLLREMDIFADDTIWMEQFLADPLTLKRIQELTNPAMQLLSWSVKFTPGETRINRRLSSLALIDTDSLDKQLQQILSLVEIAESKPVSKEVGDTKMERLQKESPHKATALAGLYLLGLILIGFTLVIGLPFALIMWLR